MSLWSWMSVFTPWEVPTPDGLGQHFLGQTEIRVFSSARTARADLQSYLDDGNTDFEADPRRWDPQRRAAALLRSEGRNGELMMWVGAMLGWVIFEIPPGMKPLTAGVSALKRWEPSAYRSWLGYGDATDWEDVSAPGLWFPLG
ncbi:hypothetical protein ACQP1V_20815 [Microtetraspora malaysiensis]|uniref:hypothetical protein n=1 Tax=Microtetraspora malaysiensis TaxID=161358 RepID=UPI003D8AE39B